MVQTWRRGGTGVAAPGEAMVVGCRFTTAAQFGAGDSASACRWMIVGCCGGARCPRFPLHYQHRARPSGWPTRRRPHSPPSRQSRPALPTPRRLVVPPENGGMAAAAMALAAAAGAANDAVGGGDAAAAKAVGAAASILVAGGMTKPMSTVTGAASAAAAAATATGADLLYHVSLQHAAWEVCKSLHEQPSLVEVTASVATGVTALLGLASPAAVKSWLVRWMWCHPPFTRPGRRRTRESRRSACPRLWPTPWRRWWRWCEGGWAALSHSLAPPPPPPQASD